MLSIITALLSPFKRIGGWLGAKPAAAMPDPTDGVSAARSEISTLPAVPAVAGFVLRLPPPPTNFHLAARLASVAHLNTRAGRAPYVPTQPVTAAKAMPTVTTASRKRGAMAPAVTKRPSLVRGKPSNNVVALPTAAARCIALADRIKNAA